MPARQPYAERYYIHIFQYCVHSSVVKVDQRIRWHYTTTILRLRIGARLTRYRNYKFHNGCCTISRHADGISRYSVPPSAGPLLPLAYFNIFFIVYQTYQLCHITAVIELTDTLLVLTEKHRQHINICSKACKQQVG